MMELTHIKEVAKYFNASEVAVKSRIITHKENLIDRKYVINEQFQIWIYEKENSITLRQLCDDYARELTLKSKISTNFFYKTQTLLKGYKYGGARVFIDPVWDFAKGATVFVHKDDVLMITELIKEMYLFSMCQDKDIFDYLMDYIQNHNPDIGITVMPIIENDKYSLSVKNELLNYLRFHLKNSVARMDYSEKQIVLKEAEDHLSHNAVALFVDCLNYALTRKTRSETAVFVFSKHQNEFNNKLQQYDRNTYFTVAYMVFNEKHWVENNMIEKAVKSVRHSKVWLYHAMHFVCAWRSKDIRSKLPRIELLDSPEEVLIHIQNNEYQAQYYICVVDQALFQFQYRSWNKNPSKIEKNSTAQPLRIQIAESAKPVIGMLMLLCEAHNRLDSNHNSLCDTNQVEALDGIKLFGQLYEKTLVGRAFSNRRANKNFMNLLSEASEQEDIDGYMVAAYARSHTGKADSIPQVTERYLSAQMDGYSPDEIARCLFERGVCSFVPYLLCDSLADGDFKKKTINEQTEIIHSLNMTPAEVETIIKMDYELEAKCQKHIQDILRWTKTDSIGDVAKDVLNNIISGNALGKEEGIYCMAKSCGIKCLNVQRGSCIGCGHEMYSKALFIMLSAEILKQENKLDTAQTNAEKIKRSAILDKKLYPAVYEMLLGLKNIYDIDITEYKKIIKRSDIYGIIGES